MSSVTLSRAYAANDLAAPWRRAGMYTPTYGPVVACDILPGTRGRQDNWRLLQTAWWWRRLLAGALCAALVLAAPICVAYRNPIWHQIQLSILRQPVAYDELYFTASTALPVQVAPDVTSRVAFGIRRDGPPATVRYKVFLTDSRGTSRARAGSVRLGAAVPSVVVERFRVPVSGPFEFEVRLLPSGPDIMFHGQAS